MEQWWKRAGVIFAGGAVGTACRALLLHALDQQTVALAVVNLTGCLLVGVVSGWWGARTSLLRLFLAVGGVGAFTSWSSLALQGIQDPVATVVVVVEALAGVGAAGLGHLLGARTQRRRRPA